MRVPKKPNRPLPGVGDAPLGVANWMRTLLQPSVMMKDCLPTRLHSVSRDTEHLNTQTSSSGGEERTRGWGGRTG